MIIRRSIDKEEVKDMPKALFPGQIHVVQTPQEAERAVAYLKNVPYWALTVKRARLSPKGNPTR